MAKEKPTTKAFLSYSRKDTEFARQLHARLQQDTLNIWADWERIPITANWMAEIVGAIEEADAFIFVISPDSLISEYCEKELAIAVENNKRLVPVLHRMPRKKQMAALPLELSAHQWVYLRTEDDFEQSVNNMVAAIHTDLDWVKGHTRVQERALNWSRNDRDPSYLLRGTDLERAENWLSTANPNRKPLPTQLQTDYLIASRRLESGRQRNQLLFTTIGLVLTIFLAIAALFAWREASAQARIALSRQLAVQAVNNLDSNPALAMLLSVQGYQVRDDLETRTSLLTTLAEYPSLYTFLSEPENTVFAVAFDPRGRWLVSGGGGRELYLWDLLNRTPYGLLAMAEAEDILALAASPDGRLLAVGDSQGSLFLWDMDAQEFITELAAHEGAVNALGFTPDGETLVSGGADGRVLFWGLPDFALEMPPQSHSGEVLTLAVSPNGRWLASGAGNGELFLWDMGERFVRRRFEGHLNEVNAVAFSADSSQLFTAGRDALVRVWRVNGGDLQFELSGHRSNIRALVISPDGRWMASGGEDQRILLWSLQRGQPVIVNELSAHTNWVNDLTFSADSLQLASASYDTNIIIWRTTTGGYGHYLGHNAPVRRVTFNPTGAWFISGAQDGTFQVWDRSTGTALYPALMADGSVFGLDISKNGQLVLTADTGGTLQLWETSTGRQRQRYQESGSQFFTTALSPDGSLAAAGGINGDNSVVLWNTTDDRITRLTGHAAFVRWVAFSPQGSILASAGWDGQVIFWNSATGQEMGRFIPHARDANETAPESGHSVLFVAFSPDGNRLVTTTSDGHNARLWALDQKLDSETNQLVVNATLVYTFEGHNDWVHGAAFSPDGQMLVTVSEDKTIYIWDLTTGKQVARLTGHQASVNTVAFSPDGKAILTGSSDNEVILWSVDFSAAPQLLCQQVNRNLSASEWEQYLGGVMAYEETCAAYLPNRP